MNKFIYKLGHKLVRISGQESIFPIELDQKDKEIFDYIYRNKLTMT
jgi:hypothetical protein